ncbi:MAG TPA: hypothetical protein VLX67_08005 [Stellaceae bacterium]|nr:hypothetical protein [Stellaceae bacterium]
MRVFLAFLIAPLWVLAAVTLLASAIMSPHPWGYPWTYAIIGMGALFGYGGTVVIGLPAFYILRARGFTAFRVSLFIGFGAGLLTWYLFLAAFAVAAHTPVDSHLIIGFATSLMSAASLLAGVLGTLVGATIWLIVRPDRQHPSSN